MTRPFKIYRNRRGWPVWYQPILEAFWILTGRLSLHQAWQAGLDEGHCAEYHRLITNRAIIAELGIREFSNVGLIGGAKPSLNPGSSAPKQFESGANAAADSPALGSEAATRTTTKEGKCNV